MAGETIKHRLGDRLKHLPLLFYGVLFVCFGMAMYLFGVLMSLPRYLLGLHDLMPLNEWIVWYSGVPIMVGILLTVADLLLLFQFKRRMSDVRVDPIDSRYVTVALTAYNDEASIGMAVKDFREHPLVKRVIVVSNNSTDHTMQRAL